jgi:hypothetical protein
MLMPACAQIASVALKLEAIRPPPLAPPCRQCCIHRAGARPRKYTALTPRAKNGCDEAESCVALPDERWLLQQPARRGNWQMPSALVTIAAASSRNSVPGDGRTEWSGVASSIEATSLIAVFCRAANAVHHLEPGDDGGDQTTAAAAKFLCCNAGGTNVAPGCTPACSPRLTAPVPLPAALPHIPRGEWIRGPSHILPVCRHGSDCGMADPSLLGCFCE